jgi:hypothetical protein
MRGLTQPETKYVQFSEKFAIPNFAIPSHIEEQMN